LRYPIWLWPNLLSLDAPAVAIAWQLLFARCFRVHVPAADTMLLGFSVWMIYVADHVIDAFKIQSKKSLAARHFFCQHHLPRVLPFFIAALCTTMWVGVSELDRTTVLAGLIMSAAIVFYFVAVHAAPKSWARYWPKELAVGLLFGVGTCLPVLAEMGGRSERMLLPLAMFTMLLSVNAVSIEYWERRLTEMWQPITRWIGRHLTAVALCVSSASLCLGVSSRMWPGPAALYFAGAAGGFSLVALGNTRLKLSSDALRVLADAALLAPAVILLLLMR